MDSTGAVLHTSNERAERSKWLRHDNSATNTNLNIHVIWGRAKLRDSIRIRIGRPNSIRFESDGPIRKFCIAAPATFAVVP